MELRRVHVELADPGAAAERALDEVELAVAAEAQLPWVRERVTDARRDEGRTQR
jgi:hypothetical protein